MPEGAEVKVITDQLNAKFGRHSLLSMNTKESGRFANDGNVAFDIRHLEYPLTDTQMLCKGKFLYWKLLDPDQLPVYFFFTLGMTGSFGAETKHSALCFEFDNETIFFNDPRHFGTFKVVEEADLLTKKLASLGWDPLQDPNIPPDFIAGLHARKGHKTIAEVMLDQKWFCGCGNYLRSEALYRAGIHPNILIEYLTHTRLIMLCKHLIEIMHEAYQAGGTTLATFSDLNGNAGAYYQQLRVYGRKQDPDGRPIEKLTAVDGRSVWYVPELQMAS
jgi:formamidopyrimidine-DNA glycosylase